MCRPATVEALSTQGRVLMSSSQSTPPPSTTLAGGAPWLVPALAFLVGVILGGVIIWVSTSSSRSGSGLSTATPTVTASVTPSDGTSSPRAAATFSVPAQCLQVADDSKAVVELVNQSVAAARDLDASKLSGLVRQIQAAQQTLQANATSCRQAKANLPPVTPTTP